MPRAQTAARIRLADTRAGRRCFATRCIGARPGVSVPGSRLYLLPRHLGDAVLRPRDARRAWSDAAQRPRQSAVPRQEHDEPGCGHACKEGVRRATRRRVRWPGHRGACDGHRSAALPANHRRSRRSATSAPPGSRSCAPRGGGESDCQAGERRRRAISLGGFGGIRLLSAVPGRSNSLRLIFFSYSCY